MQLHVGIAAVGLGRGFRGFLRPRLWAAASLAKSHGLHTSLIMLDIVNLVYSGKVENQSQISFLDS